MKSLFSEFKPITAEDWKRQLEKDLKGESFSSLVWKNENGFDIQPFYTAEDLKTVYEPAFTHADWEICVSGDAREAKEANNFFLKSLNRGATAVCLSLESAEVDLALKSVHLNNIQSTFFADLSTAKKLKKYLQSSYPSGDVSTSVFPLKFSTTKDLAEHLEVTRLFKDFSQIRSVSVNALPYHNQNCTASYEVALIFSMLTEYLESGETFSAAPFAIKTGVNSDYFMQIAKLRAIRRLWQVFKQEYKIKNELYLIVETSLANKSLSDSHNNLLRTTVEAMAAVAGGCNELLVNNFDVFFERDKNLSERMAVNQQLILKDESYLDKMADIGCGSFYIETITDQLAEKALDTFKRFERSGGYFKCLEENIFEGEIKAQAGKQAECIENNKQTVIGVNKFRNEKEKLDVNAEAAKVLKKLPIDNPVLNYELDHFFKLKNA